MLIRHLQSTVPCVSTVNDDQQKFSEMKGLTVSEGLRQETRVPSTSPEQLYLSLLKNCLTRAIGVERFRSIGPPHGSLRYRLYTPIRDLLALGGLSLVRTGPINADVRLEGRDWPSEAETMIGLKRLDNLQYCVEQVVREGIPGDLIETGVWRGGASIFMRGVLKVYGDTSRAVWVADSFCGLPRPDADLYPADAGDQHHTWSQLAVSLEEVRANFSRYGLLDEQVRFLPGWFSNTLPHAPIERLALLRLDGDMYGSTVEAFTHLYPKLAVGGYVIVDDYGSVPGCRQATDDYRAKQGVTEPIERIDRSGVFWKRLR